MFCLGINFSSRLKRNKPTSSLTSAPSYEPIVTSNNPCLFLVQDEFSEKRKVFRECSMMSISSLVTLVRLDANDNASDKRR